MNFPTSSFEATASMLSLPTQPSRNAIPVVDPSCSSSSSTGSRLLAQSRLQQLQNASRAIWPEHVPKEAEYKQDEPNKTRIELPDGTTKEVFQLPKAPYVRPQHPKAFCPYCDDHIGFRGEHELLRHIDRAHRTTRKVWVCVDISPDKKFLANCKACRARNTYGAYYNAATHLRRAHFNPCRSGRGRRGKDDEKRGGKGGGLFPPMETLKEWMVEMSEEVRESSPSLSDTRGEDDLSHGNMFLLKESMEQMDEQHVVDPSEGSMRFGQVKEEH